MSQPVITRKLIYDAVSRGLTNAEAEHIYVHTIYRDHIIEAVLDALNYSDEDKLNKLEERVAILETKARSSDWAGK